MHKVKMEIEGKPFSNWPEVRLDLVFDGFDTVNFSAPFNPDNKAFRDTFKPGTFKKMTIGVDDEKIFTGTMLPVPPNLSASNNPIQVGGYSLPGVIQDCTQAAAALPLEYKGKTLKDIAETVIEPFELSVDFQADPGPVFKKLKTSPSAKVGTFLTDLAKQRNLIVSNDVDGGMVCYQEPPVGVSDAILEQGLAPLWTIDPVINQQAYYSEITGIKPIKVRSKKSTQYTARNTLLQNIIRPLTFQMDNAEDGDLKTAVEAKMGRMFGAFLQYTLTVPTWGNDLGTIWKPGRFIRIKAPGAMIYEHYTFFIRSVSLLQNKNGEKAVLMLTMPGAYSGVIPERLPWDE